MLDQPISVIKGVGAARQEKFHKLGIDTLFDMLSHIPRAYRDLTHLEKVEHMVTGQPFFGLLEIQSEPKLSYVRRNFSVLRCRVGDDTGSVAAVWYNQPYLKQNLKLGDTLYFYGKPEYARNEVRMANPMLETLAAGQGERMLSVYKSTSGLTQSIIRKTMRACLDLCLPQIRTILPDKIIQKYDLVGTALAYETVHFPHNAEDKDRAVRTLAFEEMLLLKAYLYQSKAMKQHSVPIRISEQQHRAFICKLPFSLTSAQERAIVSIRQALESGAPMRTLLQGDVGSGKTIVAFYLLYCAAISGHQAAMMAPTEILAEQHFRQAEELFQSFGFRVVFLKSKMKAEQRRQVLQQLETGEAQIAIGTHALIQDDVVFSDLLAVVADEQHRFGVKQRAALSEKGTAPHTLIMSATPIPRTLAMIIYGDLDVLTMDELPPGRKPVKTSIVLKPKQAAMYDFIMQRAREGKQAYVVCPLIEEEEDSEKLSAQRLYQGLTKRYPDISIALLHGRMKQKDKEGIMARFEANEISILIATTVIEVGVNVPNATVMVIENADQFGVAQLHQLRGRVGRGEEQSYCFLSAGQRNERLSILTKTQDGFLIAQEDLRQRGPGSLLGTDQHGNLDLKFVQMLGDGRQIERVIDAFDEIFLDPAQRDVQNTLMDAANDRFEKRLCGIALN